MLVLSISTPFMREHHLKHFCYNLTLKGHVTLTLHWPVLQPGNQRSALIVMLICHPAVTCTWFSCNIC